MQTKRIRILELNFERTWRGGERQTLYNAKGFTDAGMDVDILCRKHFPLEKKAKENGFLTMAFTNIFGVIFFLMIKGGRYHILHVQTSHILTYVMLTKPFHMAKVVFTRRIDFIPKGIFTLLKYRLCTHVVAISCAIQRIVTNFGVKEVQLISSAVIQKQLNVARANDIISDMHLLPHTKIIATTAAFVAHKDPFTMVKAIRHLAALRNDFVFLHFGSGDMMEEVRSKIEQEGLSDVYKIMGFHNNVEDFFGLMDAFAMSSSEEGLGSSVLDAFIYKVPVVATDAGGLKDLLADGRGFMCKVKDATSLANNLDLIFRHPGSTARMVENAYEYAEKQHNIGHITRQYLKLLHLKQHTPKRSTVAV